MILSHENVLGISFNEIVNDEICQLCNNFKTIKSYTYSTYDFQNQLEIGKYCIKYYCEDHFTIQNINNISDEKLPNILRIIKEHKIDYKRIPREIWFKMGNKVFNFYANNVYKQTLKKRRDAIDTFCLICIRHYPLSINKDIRLKICKLIWSDIESFIF